MEVLKIFVFLGLATTGLSNKVCLTPNGEEALCIPINRCPVLRAAYNDPSPAVKDFLRQSECGFWYGPWVCCGTVARFNSMEPSTIPPPLFETISTSIRPGIGQPEILPTLASLVTGPNADPRSHRNFDLIPSESNCGGENIDTLIFGGNQTQLYEFPWMALLEYSKNGNNTGFQCGGLLINTRYVLTAAHCVTGRIIEMVGNPVRVRLGEHDQTKDLDCQVIVEGDEVFEDCSAPHQDINIEETIPHSMYNSTGHQLDDIALVRLVEPAVVQRNINPICLPINGEMSAPGTELFVAGWGTTETRWASDIKLKAKLPVVSLEECRKKYILQGVNLSDNQLCAGGLKGIDSCSGDSGGPIMTTSPGVKPLRWYVEGVVSFGPRECGTAGWPGVYTKVSSYLNWILDNIKP